MLDLALDFDIMGHEPVYAQLKSSLRKEIMNGRLKSLSKLPPVRDLAVAAGVSVGTMGRVVSELVDEGFCIRRPRIGIYVNRQSVLSGQKIIIHLRSGFQSHEEGYGQRVLALADNRLYPDCNIHSRYVSRECLHSPSFNYELEKIRAEHPDCLLAEVGELTREEVGRVMALPFPVLFIGDFNFGEMHDADLNLIREDTAERGFELVRAVYAAGGRTAAFFGGMPGSFYTTMLRNGAGRAAREYNIALRHYSLADSGYQLKNETELYVMKRAHIEEMLKDGRPDVMVFDGHTQLDVIVQILEELGFTVGKDLKLISNRELVSGGIFLQPDYTQFRREATAIINKIVVDHNYHPGSRMLGGMVKYRLISINNL